MTNLQIKMSLESVVLPIHVEIMKNGINAPQTIDFGLMTAPQMRYKIPLKISNNGQTPLENLDVVVA